MFPYVLHRIGSSLLMMLALAVLVFFMVRWVPGDTATAMLGTRYNEADAAILRERLALDRPLWEQLGVWLTGTLRGELGRSTTGAPVIAVIADALPVTLELTALSLLIALAFALPAGIFAALRRRTALGRFAGAVGILGVSVPGFWLGTMLILLFSLKLRWLPPGGFVPFDADPIANLRHMLLPALALGAAVAAVLMRMTYASLVDNLQADHVRTAIAKGLPRHTVIRRHALRNALIPVLTVLGIQTGYLLGGSVVIEQVFALPGLGQTLLQAILRRDYPLVQAIILLIGGGFITINLLVDLLYAWADPRITVSRA